MFFNAKINKNKEGYIAERCNQFFHRYDSVKSGKYKKNRTELKIQSGYILIQLLPGMGNPGCRIRDLGYLIGNLECGNWIKVRYCPLLLVLFDNGRLRRFPAQLKLSASI